MIKARLNDETWVPLKWIYTILGSCAISLVTIVGAVWYLSSLESRADVTETKIVDLYKRSDSQESDKKDLLIYMRSVDDRLSRMEGYLKRLGD